MLLTRESGCKPEPVVDPSDKDFRCQIETYRATVTADPFTEIGIDPEHENAFKDEDSITRPNQPPDFQRALINLLAMNEGANLVRY